jgi:hypothetical protein
MFPTSEEWGTGDEAMDNKLSLGLKSVRENLSLESISQFYFAGLGMKPRAYNPTFHVTIELVAKALLFHLSPEAYNDQLMQKMKGNYNQKEKIPFTLPNLAALSAELIKNGLSRYKGQIDFYLHHQDTKEKNPFVQYSLLRAPIDLHVKIIMKDFKAYLSKEKDEKLHDDVLFRALRGGENILLIENFGELWYDQGQIFALPSHGGFNGY